MNVAPKLCWTPHAYFWVSGTPKAEGRPRVRIIGIDRSGRAKPGQRIYGHIYTPPDSDGWKRRIAAAAGENRVGSSLNEPLKIDIDVFMPRPKYLYRKKDPDGPVICAKKPDRDNLDKAILDGLTDAKVLKDDNCVVAGGVRKWYAAKNSPPGAWIQISRLDHSSSYLSDDTHHKLTKASIRMSDGQDLYGASIDISFDGLAFENKDKEVLRKMLSEAFSGALGESVVLIFGDEEKR